MKSLSLVVYAVLICSVCSAATPQEKVTSLLQSVQQLPANSSVKGSVKTVFHKQTPLPPEALASAAKVGAIATPLKDSLAVCEETIQNDRYFCDTTVYQDVADRKPANSDRLFSETVVADAQLVVCEHRASEQVNFTIGASTQAVEVQKQVMTPSKAIAMVDLRNLQSNIENAPSADWRESSNLIEVDLRRGTGEIAGRVSFRLDSAGRLVGATLSRIDAGGQVLPHLGLAFGYDSGMLPTSMMKKEYSSYTPGEVPTLHSTVEVQRTIQALPNTSTIPTVKSYLESKHPKEVIDHRQNDKRVPFSALTL